MKPHEYVYAINRLGLTGATAAALLGVDRRTHTRYANGHQGVPKAMGMLLELLTAHPQDVRPKRDMMLRAVSTAIPGAEPARTPVGDGRTLPKGSSPKTRPRASPGGR